MYRLWANVALRQKAPRIAIQFNNNNVDISEYFATSTFNNVVRSQVGFFFDYAWNHMFLCDFFDEFHSFESELWVMQQTLLCYEKHGSLPTLVMMFRVTPVFMHIVLAKQEAVSLCLSESVIHRPIWPIFQCVVHIIIVVKVLLSNNCTVIIIGVDRPPDK